MYPTLCTTLYLAAIAYVQIGAAMLTFRGDHIYTPRKRIAAWLLWPWRKWFPAPRGLYAYFAECWAADPYPIIDHCLRVDRLPDGSFHFYIHPQYGPGTTTDFIVTPTKVSPRDAHSAA